MKKMTILLAAILVLLSACSRKNEHRLPDGTDDRLYYHYQVKIVAKGDYYHELHHEAIGHYFFIQSLVDTNLFAELHSRNFDGLEKEAGSALYWSRKVGDTLYFDHIRKDRFWRKVPRTDSIRAVYPVINEN